jgi:glucose-6-phosphate dehydrogenase assembly protein OpcA
MPSSYKVLGQSNPAATTATALYTVPSSTSSVISSISIANLAATSATFRLIVQKSGETSTITDKQYIGYDITVGGSDTTIITVGLTLATGDVVKVYASTATVAFQAFGSEITA